MAHSNSMISAFDIRDAYKDLVGDNTVYSYLGKFSQEELNDVLYKLEGALNSTLSSKLATRKIYNILVESLQNIYGYLENNMDKSYLLEAFVAVNDLEGSFRVVTGNYMMKKDKASIQSRIEIVNSLSQEELRDLYRGVLDIGSMSSGGGAGLGFIDMAKRSASQLVYEFKTVDSEHLFFTLQLDVKS